MFMSVTTDIMNSKYAMNVRFKQYVGLIKILLITQATKTILRQICFGFYHWLLQEQSTYL